MTDSNEIKVTNAPHVLLVEDNQLNQKVGVLLLEMMGCSIDVANTGECALEMFDDGQYDVIFMDVGLPGISGLDVTAEIRRREKARIKHRIPIIAMTAHMDVEATCIDAGLDALLIKPIMHEQLKNVLDFWLEKSRQAMQFPVEEPVSREATV